MRLPRSTGALSGGLIVLLGIWGALIPFVGPYFDYSFGTNSSWHYTTDRLWLSIVPGAVAVLGGLALLSSATRVRGAIGGWLAVIGGAWFAIGPAVSTTWERAGGPIGSPLGGTTRQALELIGYFYGLGVLIVALAAFATGRFASRPRMEADVVAPDLAAATAPRRARRRRLRAPRLPLQRRRHPAAHGDRADARRTASESERTPAARQ